MGGMSIWHWLIVLLIVVLVFGSKKLGNVGSDLGRAIRDFKKGLNDDDKETDEEGDEDKPEPQLKADDAKPGESRKASEQKARERDN